MCNKYVSGNDISVSTYTQDTNMKTLYSMLERLAELFPKQDYHSRLERYLTSKNLTSTSEVESWSQEFMREEGKGFYQ